MAGLTEETVSRMVDDLWSVLRASFISGGGELTTAPPGSNVVEGLFAIAWSINRLAETFEEHFEERSTR